MSESAIPAHVPRELVRDNYVFAMGLTTTEHPFETPLARLHDDADIIYSSNAYPINIPAWIPRTMEYIQAVYMDDEHFTTENSSPFPLLVGGKWKVTPIEIDPPHHAGYRRFLNPLFTPKRLKALDEKVRNTARELIAAFKDRGECEFMEAFSMQFPIAVFLDLMGLPKERMQQFLEWENMLLHSPDLERITEGTRQVIAYLEAVIEQRKQQPKDDFISEAIAYEMDGRKLNDDELVGICFNLYIGGLDTVTTNISWQVRHLAEHPEHQQQLRDNPRLISNAVENMYRRYAAVTTFRTCIKPFTLGDVTIMPGDKVSVSTTLANNDPAYWGDPAAMDIEKAPRHITFGYGIHRCVGAALARRESVVAIEELLSALPSFGIAPGAELHSALGPILQPINLPLSW